MISRILAVCLLWGLPAGAADLNTLLDSVVQAYGGPAAAALLQTHRVEADVVARMRGATGRVRRDFRAPDKLRVEIRYPDATEVRVLNGDSGWRGDAGQLRRVQGLPELAMVYQLLRSGVPWVFVHHRKKIEDRGTVRRGGSEFRVVGLPWSPGLDLTFWIDSANRRVRRVEALLRDRGQQSLFATEYDDFRRVDGVLVPFAEENFASGHHTGTTRVRAVTFGPQGLGPFDPGTPATP